MEKTPERPKVSISEHRVLVDAGKSKKLVALANKSAAVSPPVAEVKPFSGLQSDSDLALQQARQLMDTRIHEIMSSLPEGRRNKLFSFRFGSVEAIHALEIKAAFKQLGITPPHLNMRLLAAINYHGDTV